LVWSEHGAARQPALRFSAVQQELQSLVRGSRSMIRLLRTRLQQGHRTSTRPVDALQLPERFRGRPEVTPSLCDSGCRGCADACPTEAIDLRPLRLDLGACVFCG